MDFFYFLAAFLIIRRINKSLKFSILYPKWKTMLSTATWIIIVGFIASFALEDYAKDFIGAAVLFGLIYYASKEQDFTSQHSYLLANIPLAAMGLVNCFSELFFDGFHEKYNEYFSWATLIAFAWIFGKWATSKKQEEELRISAERRAELEVLVQERTVELQKQKDELQETLQELKTTQAQLIQSEKMASLGELTAGIAHEIQNPLNFVNNFSEVTAELIEEMELELDKGDKDEAIAIASDIKQNLQKIMHHGKRADGIVKGMLQHSRASSNVKEPTDINKLADEYLRLAYHGLRAKDKSFNADLITHFAEGLPEVSMVPQDIGRVLLNLFNNAFYATKEKQKTAGTDYKPAVEITTHTKGKSLEIIVKDNGTGIPDEIKEKILQPFFTTKPTGEGTGLGLSLSYDIVVKAHSGKIDVKSKAGEGSEFRISIPV
ncbi:sensor histidine kinase [Mucilaginibacter sp. BT774]|uniref:sensor histidine kinase n=1 Tax=Mucilaginibacter sp. BT774 TaxID=3062276 RepID=UPI0026760658|nr:ATP-binding protein [Mucilaginibacter sp. BT774]MDO3629034.1 ATP-binding protein [Mucilaginibacter sp. BT774]